MFMKKKKLPYESTPLEIIKIFEADVISTSDPNSPFDDDDNVAGDSWTKN